MTKNTEVKTLDISNIETNLDEINTVENYISQILIEDNFNKLNYLQNRKSQNESSGYFNPSFKIESNNGNLEFISIDMNSFAPYSTIMSENEFFRIVGLTKKGMSARSGKYQESLYSFYMEALKENDNGFISDILNKARIFENNLNYVKRLMKNKSFMKEWRKNFGKESPITIFKNSGSLRKINIINERTK